MTADEFRQSLYAKDRLLFCSMGEVDDEVLMAVRAAVIEECAQACDEMEGFGDGIAGESHYAKRIRGLK